MAAKEFFLCFENSYYSMLLKLILKGQGTNKKGKHLWSFAYSLVTKVSKEVWVLVATLGRQMGTKCLGYFSLTPLNNHKIFLPFATCFCLPGKVMLQISR